MRRKLKFVDCYFNKNNLYEGELIRNMRFRNILIDCHFNKNDSYEGEFLSYIVI